jgi:hypothetical protein
VGMSRDDIILKLYEIDREFRRFEWKTGARMLQELLKQLVCKPS